MTIYIALLRGINVGGKNKIKMAELKSLFQSLGCSRVQTYIQSGNVVFESSEEEVQLHNKIEQEIANVFSITLHVVIRTATELERVIENCPFSEDMLKEAKAATEAESFYVSFLSEPPAQERVNQLSPLQNEENEFQIHGKDVYLLLREGIRNSKLANNLYKLNVPSTIRNWKTVNKLHAMAKATEG